MATPTIAPAPQASAADPHRPVNELRATRAVIVRMTGAEGGAHAVAYDTDGGGNCTSGVGI